MKNKIVIGIIVVIFILLGGYFLKKHNDKEENSIISVQPYKITRKKIEEIIKSKGKVEAKETKKIYVSTAQKVSKVNCKVGDMVHEGDVLIEFDDSDKNTLLREIKILKIDLQNEKLNLDILKEPVNNIEVLKKEVEIKQTEANIASLKEEIKLQKYKKENINTKYNRALRNYLSKKRLYNLGGISKNDLDKSEDEKTELKEELKSKSIDIINKENDLKNYEDNLKLEKNNYIVLVDDYNQALLKRNNNIKRSENDIKKYEIQLEEKYERMSKLKENIISPFTGTVLEKIAEKNMLVDTEKSLLELANTSSKIITAKIATYDIGKIKLGDKVRIKIETTDKDFYTGKVSKILNIASEMEGQGYSETVVEIEISITDKKFNLKPGYDVNLEIVTAEKDKALVTSALSIVYEQDKRFVYKIQGDTLKKVKIETGLENINEAELLLNNNELKESDEIVENPTPDLHDNLIVKIQKEGEN